jgi:oxygen-dependent protoporphyrinogen oxidase
MACTWLGTKWAERVPAGKAVFRCFSTDPNVSRDAILEDLNRLMGLSAEPIFEIAHRWPDSMPQYSVGHIERVAEMDARAAAIPAFSLIGNAFHGVGIPDCVRLAKEAAARI